ncbi:MAG TPA: hypothetical protein PLM14_13845 [Candidatus Hydrogenedentes bacterium]|nr:hypothetical protein [Candidatus Hydrogenedentota bacterium]HQE84079.1 hypothetical protein [Candidatus Hydrogenedentota bacterium]HQH51137.1 hypothetical protein [Candidatus Hydrogenedentota bacterium]HQM47443.1 hypothetical protein [Candidatus Hydrogenedentota bacterium]
MQRKHVAIRGTGLDFKIHPAWDKIGAPVFRFAPLALKNPG